jgi:uncharacterized protein YukE
MTREEARSILQALVTHYNAFSEESAAICMAIEALEAPPNDNWEGYSSRLWKSAYERGRADAEQTSALNKAREEIAAYGSIWVEYCIPGHTDHDIEVIVENVLKQAKEQVLAVIDKHRAESEEI